ncbi:hypothetical protein H6G41_08950 [Tolypothrix sp. FACHB-123]|uniref:hypothetical protein n=1 Tax=Tolypothrix sp. FACHB-123 TaxID=2692868 RepID=UPI001688B9B9|nr:hypothetical protein [Tolypothrix sp. FACHB-123]MBD2354755.1 hypothetical protein [Tolypothrix sp. FACHB-123]
MRNQTTWESGSTWNHGETTTIRVPIALVPEVKRYARAIDSDFRSVSQRVGDASLVLQAIEAYIQYKRTKHHPNQHSRELDINTRAWDELRKFRQLLKDNPSALGLE